MNENTIYFRNFAANVTWRHPTSIFTSNRSSGKVCHLSLSLCCGGSVL